MSNFEILHLQHSYLFSKIIPFLDLEKRPKIVITLRGGDTYIKPWLDKRWLDFYVDYSQKIDSFVVMSHDQKNYLMRWQVPNEKIFVIPISFGSKSTAQAKFPNADKIMLVSAFRMTWEKNIEGSIQLARLLKEKNIAFQYDIYGDGNDLGQLYYLVDKYDLQEFVHIKGSVSNDILKEKLLKYDFFLQLSISDAMPASVIEAQSLGLPCIVSESDGIKEGIVHNKSGISSAYYNIDYFANEIISLWNDRARYFQFSAAAIQFANENYSLEVEVKRTVAMYNSLL
jgi:glycosyltransferase involved in cell wall biosynthesis